MRFTQNGVFFSDNGTQFFVVDGPNDTATGKPTKVLKNAAGETIERDKVKRLEVTDIESALKFVAAHNALPCKPRSGYDNYKNDDGPINPISPRNLTVGGSLRNILIDLQALHLKVAEGGAVGDEASKALSIIAKYNKVAGKHADAELRRKKLEAVANTGIDPTELAEYLAKRKAASEVPPATVTADEPTIEDLEEVAESNK
jgi:ubiquitin